MQDGSDPIAYALTAIDRLERELFFLRTLVDVRNEPDTVRTRSLEIVDENGTTRIRAGQSFAGDFTGIELFSDAGKLLACFGADTDPYLGFVGGEQHTIVLKIGSSASGAYLTVADPADPSGVTGVDLAPRWSIR